MGKIEIWNDGSGWEYNVGGMHGQVYFETLEELLEYLLDKQRGRPDGDLEKQVARSWGERTD